MILEWSQNDIPWSGISSIVLIKKNNELWSWGPEWHKGSALVEVMTLRRTRGQPIPGPIHGDKFAVAYMHRQIISATTFTNDIE